MPGQVVPLPALATIVRVGALASGMLNEIGTLMTAPVPSGFLARALQTPVSVLPLGSTSVKPVWPSLPLQTNSLLLAPSTVTARPPDSQLAPAGSSATSTLFP